MASRVGLIGTIGCLIVMVALLNGASAETYNVGGDMDWSEPPLGEISYRSWAAKNVFEIGDVIGTYIVFIDISDGESYSLINNF